MIQINVFTCWREFREDSWGFANFQALGWFWVRRSAGRPGTSDSEFGSLGNSRLSNLRKQNDVDLFSKFEENERC